MAPRGGRRTDARGPHVTGVLGWPLTHTLSPVIHNAAYRDAGLGWVYFAWPVPPERLGDAVSGLRALGAVGANVTIPHKQTVVPSLDALSGDAAVLETVNTIERVGDRLIGHNTDTIGFAEFMTRDAGCSPRGKTVLVMGAGGAARAVIHALGTLGVAEVTVAARRREEADSAGSRVAGSNTRSIDWDRSPAAAEAADIVINASPVGSGGEDCLPGARFRSGQLVVDLIYAPPSTVLVEKARAAGADAWGGLGMLLRQASASFRIWTGRDAPTHVMSAAAIRAIGART